MKKAFLLIFTAFLLVSCTKNNPTGPDNEYLNGNSNPENSYYPTSKGTWWKYEGFMEGQAISQTTTIEDEVKIDDVYYAKMITARSSQQFEGYIRVKNNDYLIFNL